MPKVRGSATPQATDPRTPCFNRATSPAGRGDVTMRSSVRLALLALTISFGSAAQAWAVGPQTTGPAAVEEPTSDTARRMALWAAESGDNRGLPFIIIDKVTAEVWVFDASGELRGVTPALLGFARGDDSVPGIGERALEKIRPEERTTPAGRFVANFGRAAGARDTFWVDYATAISLHPVPTSNPKERRLQRLRSVSPDDNRITYGCINVTAAFYRDVVRKTFAGASGIVYILPEAKPLDEVFPTFQLQAAAGAGPADSAYGE
jgi:hypothetical protein